MALYVVKKIIKRVKFFTTKISVSSKMKIWLRSSNKQIEKIGVAQLAS